MQIINNCKNKMILDKYFWLESTVLIKKMDTNTDPIFLTIAIKFYMKRIYNPKMALYDFLRGLNNNTVESFTNQVKSSVMSEKGFLPSIQVEFEDNKLTLTVSYPTIEVLQLDFESRYFRSELLEVIQAIENFSVTEVPNKPLFNPYAELDNVIAERGQYLAAQEWLRGTISDEAAVSMMADRFGNLVNIWQKARG